nr:hypothetical protein [Tanacetum cinerariifolium]
NAQWLYWKSGNDEEVLTYDELYNLEEENLHEEDGIWKEPTNDICHECKPFDFKSRHVEWPTCNWKEDGYCNGGDLLGVILEGILVYFQDYEWCEGLEDETNVNYSHDTYYNVCQMFKNRARINNDGGAIQANQERFVDHEPMEDDDDDIGDLDDYLIQDDAPYYVDEEEE